MTTLFLGRFGHGRIVPSDDISELSWIDSHRFVDEEYIERNIMPEHVELMVTLMKKVLKKDLIANMKKL